MRAFQRAGIWTIAGVLLAPLATLRAEQRPGWAEPARTPAYDFGYRAGLRFGEDHGRRHVAFNFDVINDYRHPETIWRSEYGNRDVFCTTFRSAFEIGYREAYGRFLPVPTVVPIAPTVVPVPAPYPTPYAAPYATAVGPSYAVPYGAPYAEAAPVAPVAPVPGVAPRTIAFDNGFRDGYTEGLNDGRHRHRNDPFAESRYRSASHDYRFIYGSLEAYRYDYRGGFENGYERGYSEGWYGR